MFTVDVGMGMGAVGFLCAVRRTALAGGIGREGVVAPRSEFRLGFLDGRGGGGVLG
jgi:hypothetical protein